jgi:mono/diheme cytochrome c family protein
MRSNRVLASLLLLLVLSLLAFAGWVVAMNLRGEEPLPAKAETLDSSAAVVARGAYLALAGNCAGCHTARGGQPYAGGRAIDTPFGTVYASNLTPDAEHGLGRWTPADFRRAMRHGRSVDGRLLLPAFPYEQYTLLERADLDALFAYLRSRAAVSQPTPPHALRFPFDLQASLAVWRALYFRPATWQNDATQSAAWNRGAYLVQALGHCGACHAERNALGASHDARALGGGMIAGQPWYAPSLRTPAEGGVQTWTVDEVVALLKTGTSAQGSVLGPMADVVYRSTQHLELADLQAMAGYLKSLPELPAPPMTPGEPAGGQLELGAQLYERHCAECHGARGEGLPGQIPPLAGARAVTLAEPANVVRAVLWGGFLPATAGNPRPFGMPPFAHQLSDEEIAALVSHLRRSWGHRASAVTALDVRRYR